MQISAWFPTRDIGTDPVRIRDWAQAAEELGYDHIEVPDHVFGATARDGWSPRYNEQDPFHETFVTLGFLAGVTTTIGLASGVLILPQRQTGVVAKQATQVDILSGGRLRLGVGVGWNHVEYEALNEDWKSRGTRQREQVEVLKKLWCDDLVTYQGRFHQFTEVNITPRPVQRPIPVWFGGSSDAVVKRAAQIGDGWMPIMAPDHEAEAKLEQLRNHLSDCGRDTSAFGIEGWLRMDKADPDEWSVAAEGWRKLGADIVMLYPMYRIPNFDDQIETLRRFKEVVSG
ncbi:MAG TPA: LLM class F420-dependent oxidoreductase [Gammaproteobacteria bacterium]|jgi:probable F420-dependent oxidoreductase|nr:LLM class F420-dependent oxidoreductase [Gammaproteobacteria bacterium]HIF79677.1 LLM class F420-dependent oxidoreductase [Gammaproteobacteria bacterium]HIM06668.1 LLM class F420-dependent oxidoreductase [Gammaproteobacteria bacterium]|tara:strand:+ start:3400 stop:4257 length:858 start_codon:yes stop_codon:yes gene_type:complete